MKKILLLLLVFALVIGGIFGFLATRSLGISTGRCLVVDEDTVMLVKDNSPIVMHPRSAGRIPADLSTGDEILVIHDGIQESFPAGTGVYAVVRLESGSMEDIPAGVIEQLKELGWLS